jgi:hypothetical protein
MYLEILVYSRVYLVQYLTLNTLATTVVAPPSNARIANDESSRFSFGNAKQRSLSI